MRLINCSSLELEEFIGSNIPEYVILSHRWEEEEVSFAEFTRDKTAAEAKRGFRKIDLTCRQALKNGYQYAWIDTCCIDKTSSAELSETINSMFGWYESSKICYVYLSDVREADSAVQFPASKWFTRGWTLQELLAPENVEFFDQDWKPIGTKHGHAKWISEITSIDVAILSGMHDMFGRPFPQLRSFCVAKRLSWASRRVTTRIEDTAYALLGIFNINMPLLYGEGLRAFTRLQEEILKQYGDESILAWALNTDARHPQGLLPAIVTEDHPQTVLGGNILASSPESFRNCQDLVSVSESKSALAMTSVGLQIELPLIEVDTTSYQNFQIWVGLLSCSTTSNDLVGIVLRGSKRLKDADNSPLRVERLGLFRKKSPSLGFASAECCSAVVMGPRAAIRSSLHQVIIVERDTARLDEHRYRMRRSQICINESGALRDTGIQCTEGVEETTTWAPFMTSKSDVYWDPISKMMSIDSETGCDSIVSFCFELPYQSCFSISRFDLFFHTGCKRAWVYSENYLTNERYKKIHWRMEKMDLEENIDSLILLDRESRPFKLRVTIEEKEIHKWRVFEINIDAKFEIGSKKLETTDKTKSAPHKVLKKQRSSRAGHKLGVTVSKPSFQTH
jgi:hypothetical protein